MRILLVVAAFLAFVHAKRLLVLVGPNGEPTYEPSSLIVKKGDVITFRFVSDNYTVTQSSFVNPCEPLTTPPGGVDSGFVSVADDATTFPEWSLVLQDDTVSLWFYCAQARHCRRGMVFAINPTPERTYKMYKTIAMGISIPGIPGSPTPSVSIIGPVDSGGATAGFLPTGLDRTLTAELPSATEVGSGNDTDVLAENGSLRLSAGGVAGVALISVVVTLLVASVSLV